MQGVLSTKAQKTGIAKAAVLCDTGISAITTNLAEIQGKKSAILVTDGIAVVTVNAAANRSCKLGSPVTVLKLASMVKNDCGGVKLVV
jgi:hypothetical protein